VSLLLTVSDYADKPSLSETSSSTQPRSGGGGLQPRLTPRRQDAKVLLRQAIDYAVSSNPGGEFPMHFHGSIHHYFFQSDSHSPLRLGVLA